eukprot:9202977-Alexandrium_andersonii.AAC.1
MTSACAANAWCLRGWGWIARASGPIERGCARKWASTADEPGHTARKTSKQKPPHSHRAAPKGRGLR